jgi:two-component system, NtrC family, response regulator AtoC
MSTMKRILVVDDEESIRISLTSMLRHQGYQVTPAASAAEALDFLKRGELDIDVVLADVRMPDMDGIELTRRIVSSELPVTIIVMSAYGSVESAMEAMKAGAYDYITKPFKTDEVFMTLKKANERETLRRENAALKAKMVDEHDFEGIIGRSEPMQRVFKLISKVADYKSTVLITGESGTGKELVARAIHRNSSRVTGPFVAVNCGAIPGTLLESELFGHRRGAFTDAHTDKAGIFAEAQGGTLLLDELGELPLPLQVKLLRTLQEGTIRPVGDTKDISVDVRIIAATIRDLSEEVKNGTFREDLFYRLNVLPIHLPPLRERTNDINLLIEHFINRHNKRLGTDIEGISPEAERLLLSYRWPGNVRELENTIERTIVLAEGRRLEASDLPDRVRESRDPIHLSLSSGELSIKKTVRIIEEELIKRALAKTNGNRTAAAKYLEISHRALLYKIKSYGIS